MNYKINFTPEAINDLQGIFEYIAFNLQSAQYAEGLLDRLNKRIAALNQMPERFRLYEKEPWRSRHLHIMPVEHYLVFYIPDRDNGIVTIIRVMYGGRDVDRVLKEQL